MSRAIPQTMRTVSCVCLEMGLSLSSCRRLTNPPAISPISKTNPIAPRVTAMEETTIIAVAGVRICAAMSRESMLACDGGESGLTSGSPSGR